MKRWRVGDRYELEHQGQRFAARRRLDQARGFALVTWWGGFLGNCDTLSECERRIDAWLTRF